MAAHSRLIPLSEPQQWLQALAGLDHGFGHRPEYAGAAASVTGLETFLWLHEEAAGRGACVISLRPGAQGPDLVTPLGFAGFALHAEPAGLAAEWTRFWQAQGATAAFVQLSPFHAPEVWRTKLKGFERWLSPARECWCWDLRPEPDALLAAMSSKHRQLLHKWQRESQGLCWDAEQVLAHFCRFYSDFLRQHPVAGVYAYGEREVSQLLAAPGALLVGARSASGEIEAAMLYLHANGRAESFLSASTDAGRQHSRGLYWGGALRLRELGVHTLNLGGGIRPGDGLSEFKQRLGAKLSPTLALRQVLDSPRYLAACAAAGVSADEDGFFPPWRAPA